MKEILHTDSETAARDSQDNKEKNRIVLYLSYNFYNYGSMTDRALGLFREDEYDVNFECVALIHRIEASSRMLIWKQRYFSICC
jgi:hypothetical protein